MAFIYVTYFGNDLEAEQGEIEPKSSPQENKKQCGTFSWCISIFSILIPILSMFIVSFVAREYMEWHSHFRCKHKYERWHPKCISNSALPHSIHGQRKHLLNPKVKNAKNGSSTFILNLNKSGKLDADHIYMSFLDYLWGIVFIGLNAFFLMVTGVFKLHIRSFLHKKGLITLKPFNPSKLVGTICLDWMQVIHYESTRICENSGKRYGLFKWPNIPLLQIDGSFVVGECLCVEVDLEAKEMKSACLDGRKLQAEEVVTLLAFNALSVNHVLLHAYANWGVNSDITEIPFMRKMALSTILYNHFGYAGVPRLCMLWKKLGLCKYNYRNLQKIFHHGILNFDAFCHDRIIELSPYSRTASFVIKVRGMFLETFKKYKDSFHGIDPEAMFIGTVLHSLDHSMFEWTINDPLWLDDNHPEFGLMAELVQFTRAGFVEKLPFVPFKRYFHERPHPFHEEIYNYAVTIDKEFADNMDTCIIR